LRLDGYVEFAEEIEEIEAQSACFYSFETGVEDEIRLRRDG
jgi:hypothetical protein